MNLQSHLRHIVTYLAGLGTAFASWHLIAPDSAAAVDAAAQGLAAPLTALAGAIAVGVSRQAMTWLYGIVSDGAFGDHESNQSGGPSAWGLVLLTGVTAAGVGLSLPSCSPAAWQSLKSIPIRAGIITDYGTASYSSEGGVELDVNGTAIEQAVDVESGK